MGHRELVRLDAALAVGVEVHEQRLDRPGRQHVLAQAEEVPNAVDHLRQHELRRAAAPDLFFKKK